MNEACHTEGNDGRGVKAGTGEGVGERSACTSLVCN